MKKWLDEKLLIFAWSFIIVICLLIIFTSPVEAATSQNQLPFKFDQVDNYNDWITQDIIDSIEDYGLPIYDDDYVLTVLDFNYYAQEGNYKIYRGWFALIPIDKFANTSPNQDFYNTALSYTKVTGLNSYFFGVHFDYFGGFTPIVFSVNDNYSDIGSLFGHSPSNITIEGYPYIFTSYVPAYFNQNFYSNNDNLVLEFNDVPIVDQGHATPPDLTSDNIGSDKPDIDDYIPTLPNKPSIDNSSLESLVESLIDLLDWQFSYLTGVLKGLIKYLGDTITYSLQKVIDNIKNAIQNFYDNMKSLFEPLLNAINEALSSISSGIEYIKEPLSGTAIYDNLSGTGIMTNYNSIVTAVNTFKDSFTNLNEPSTFTIPIHLEDLPSSMFGDLTTQYIDLSVINSVKPILRTFVWALVTYGLIITIFDSIANYINGGGDE